MSEHPIDSAEFWAAAPECGTLDYWKLVLAQTGTKDQYEREILICGHGAAGPIRCTRQYAQSRLELLQDEAKQQAAAANRKAAGEARSEAARRAQAEKGRRHRSALERAWVRVTSGVA